jgi:ABC-type spermidine/putrescine transport system permease subunit I
MSHITTNGARQRLGQAERWCLAPRIISRQIPTGLRDSRSSPGFGVPISQRVDPSYAQAAATLGIGPVRGFLRFCFPLTLPGVFTGGALAFVLALGYYIVPALLGGLGETMIAQVIEQQVADFGNWGMGGALSATLLVCTGIVLAVVMRLYGWKSAWRQ